MEEPERIVFRQVLSLNRCFRHGSIVGNNVLAVNQPLGPMCNGRNYRRAVSSKVRVSPRRLDHAGDTTLRRPCRIGKQWTSSDDHWRQPRSRAQVHKAKRVTRCSGVPQAPCTRKPLRITSLRNARLQPPQNHILAQNHGEGYRPATTNSSIPGEPPAAPFALAGFSLPTLDCRLLPVASHRGCPGAPICTNCPAATGGGAIGFGFKFCFPRQLSNIPTC